jgi:hypothetical protein
MITSLYLLASCLMIASGAPDRGAILGIVLNASSDRKPVSRAEVVLRAEIQGQSIICGETLADESGRFVFENLSFGREYVYLPGANHQGIHYPGPQIRLDRQQSQADVELEVFDAVSTPSPLVIRHQEIALHLEPGALRVTESLQIDNPQKRTYVGLCPEKEGDPITLQLSIPPEFQRITFQQEFYGRRFTLRNGKLVTSIPWTPGSRELTFSYILPLDKSAYYWQRMLDLPCQGLHVVVQTAHSEGISCNLPASPSSAPGEVAFQSLRGYLPQGYPLRVEWGQLPTPWIGRARWVAVFVLIFMIVGSSSILTFRRKKIRLVEKIAAPPSHRHPAFQGRRSNFR